MPLNSFEVTRRDLLARAMAMAVVAGLPAWYAKDARAAEFERIGEIPKRIGANDKINFGLIGAGGSKGGYRRGLDDARLASIQPGCKVIAVCDVDKQHLEEAAHVFGPNTAKIHDFRELLSRKDIDAVVIGTPDHWHVTIAIAALHAGKDVYCEKPLTLTIDEGKKLVKTWRNCCRIFQVGSQQRSDKRFRLACELVRNGRIGKIIRAIAHLPTGPTGGPFASQPVPSDLDWDMWQGPTPFVEYVPERIHGLFRWWLEYSGGMMTDWGAHHNDIAQWGLGTDRSGPISVEAIGQGPTIGLNCYNTFPEFDVTSIYSDGTILLTTNKGDNGVEFEGESGTIFVTRGAIRASDQRLLDDPLPANATRLYVSDDHMGNFVGCMRSRKDTICDPEIGHRSATICHLANISLRLGGRKLNWDPVKEEFKRDKEASVYLRRPTRKPWRI